jgi:ketosteroid isomerase-like protein
MKLGRVVRVVCLWTWIVCLSPLAAPVAAQAPAAAPAASPAMAPAAVPPGQAASEDADRAALRQLRGAYEAAISNNRIDDLAPLLHDDFHGVMVTGRAVTGLAGLKQYWTDMRALMGEGGRYTTALKPETSVFVGDLAMARGTSDDVVTTSSGEFHFTTQWTAVLQKVNGQWKVRLAHGSMDPVDNAFTRTFTRRALQWSLPIAGIAGILAGYAVGKIFSRRRRA